MAARRRHSDFDRLVEPTIAILDDTVAIAGLGVIARRMAAEARELFVPNISHGIVSVPAGQENGYAVIPAKDIHDNGRPLYLLDSTMILQTPRRTARNRWNIIDTQPTPMNGTKNPQSSAFTSVQIGNDPRAVSRPTIVIDRTYALKRLQHAGIATVIHELVHAIYREDAERVVPTDTPEQIATFERPAYYAGNVIFYRLCELSEPSEMSRVNYGYSQQVEAASPATLGPGGFLPEVLSPALVEMFSEK